MFLKAKIMSLFFEKYKLSIACDIMPKRFIGQGIFCLIKAD